MSRQATLFQSWGKKQQTSTSGKPTGGTNNADRGDHVTSGISNDQGDIVNLCDEDDEDMYLAMAMEESLKTAEAEGHYIQCEDPQPSTSFAKPPASVNPAPISRKPKVQSSLSSLFKSVGSVPGSSTNPVDGTTNEQDDLPMTEDELPDLSNIEDIPGFDKMAGRMWIYPTNYQVRGYQLNIVKESLFTNTLVSLPTGLGKTFIAAVVMYNFYRWYPQGKVVFMAPTKPLVAQQIEACYNIMGIPQEDTAEMTGAMQPSERRMSWRKQRVFFLTPQVLANDLSRDVCPAVWVKCLVVDEAHKAQGNHAYCQVIRELLKHTQDFRVLALSATPGSDLKAVQQVLTNLLISHVELRTEDSADIQAYSFERKVEKVVVPLGAELTAVRDKYLHVVDVIVQRLKRQGVLYNRDSKSLSKFMVLKARDAFRQNPPPSLPQVQFGSIEGDFALCMSLYHGYELLQLHGLRSLYNFLESLMSGDKGYGRTRTELQRSKDFMEILGMLREKFNLVRCPNPSSGLMSPRASQLAQPLAIGHPKMDKLKEIILQHFETFPKDPTDDNKVNTRVMIFSQYRDSVNEITEMLNRHRPLVRVMSFIGQSSMGKSSRGFTQKEQLKVMRQFREGGYNTLVSTCVGEEGLDIGDVDLIICFDAHKSPIRLVQRMGRTGRKRQGRIVMLVTEGKEEKIYNQSQYSKRSIHRAILNGAKSLIYYPNSTRMVPQGLNPVCRKMGITVQHKFVAQSKTKHQTAQKQKSGQSPSLLHKNVSAKKTHQDGYLTEQELDYWGRNYKVKEWTIAQLPDSTFLSLPASKQTSKATPKQQPVQPPALSLSSWMPWQNRLQETVYASHSLGSQHLVQLMDFIDVHNALGEDEDNYGQEMKSYLNEDDVLQGPEAFSKTSTGILRYCTTTAQSSEQPRKQAKRKAEDKTEINSPARKMRRSAVLPAVSSDEKEENSDAELPEFDLSFTDKSKDKSTESSPASKPMKTISPPKNPAKKIESKKTTDLSKTKRKKKKSGQQSISKVQLIGDYDDDEDFLPADGTVFTEVSVVPCGVDPDQDMAPQDGMDEVDETEEAPDTETESHKDTESQTEEQDPHEDLVFSQLFPEFELQKPSISTEFETGQQCSQNSDNSKAPSLHEIDSLLEKLVIEKGRLSPMDFIELIDTWEKDEKRKKRRKDFRKSLFPTDDTSGNNSVCNNSSNRKDLKISQSRESLKINTSTRQVGRQLRFNPNSSNSLEQKSETSETPARARNFPRSPAVLKSQQPGQSAVQSIKDTRLELEASFLLDLSPWDDDEDGEETSAADPQTIDVPFSSSTSKTNSGTVSQLKSTGTLLSKSSTLSSPKDRISSGSRFSTPLVREAQAQPRSAAESFHDPFLEEDAEDDHLFAAMSTPAATGPRLQDTSQITFTQALACVHDSVNFAPDESFSAKGGDDSICQLVLGQGRSAKSRSRSNSRSRSKSPLCSVQVSTSSEEQEQTAQHTPVKSPEKPQFDLGFDLDLDDFDDDIIPPSPPSSLPFSLASRTSNIQLKVTEKNGNYTQNVSPVVRTPAESAKIDNPLLTLNQSWDLARTQLEEEEKNLADSEESSENSPSLLQPVSHAVQSEDSPVVVAGKKKNRALVFDSPAVDSPAVNSTAVKSTAVGTPDLNSPLAGTSFCQKSCVPEADFQTPIRPPGKMRLKKKMIVVSDTEESPFSVMRKVPARSLTSVRSSTLERSSTSASSMLSSSQGGDTDFEDFTVNRQRGYSHSNRHVFKSKHTASKKKGSNRGHCGFLEVEAEVSEEDGATSDEAEDEGSDFEASFVNDCTHLSQDVSVETTPLVCLRPAVRAVTREEEPLYINLDEMRAIYQRSVSSPVGRHGHGRYRLASRPAVEDMDVFSQVPEPDISHYEQDSFCVGSDYESEEEPRRGEKLRKPQKQQKAKKTLPPPKMADGRRRICKIDSSSSEDENYRLVSEEASDDSRHNRLHVQSPGGVTDTQPTQRPSLLSRCLNKLQSKSTDVANISKIPSMANSFAACSSATKTNDAPTFTLGFGLDSDFEDDEENTKAQAETSDLTTSATNLDCTRQNKSSFSWRHSKASNAETVMHRPTVGQSSKSRNRLSDISTEGGNVSGNASVSSMSKEERLRLSRLKQQQFREKMAKQQQQQQKQTHSNMNSFLR